MLNVVAVFFSVDAAESQLEKLVADLVCRVVFHFIPYFFPISEPG